MRGRYYTIRNSEITTANNKYKPMKRTMKDFFFVKTSLREIGTKRGKHKNNIKMMQHIWLLNIHKVSTLSI